MCIKEFSRLREQGANTINNASQIKQDTIVAEVGDCVHKQCRLDYICRPAVINTDNPPSVSLLSLIHISEPTRP